MVQPQNNSEAVEELLTALRLDPDQLFTLHQSDPGELHLLTIYAFFLKIYLSL